MRRNTSSRGIFASSLAASAAVVSWVSPSCMYWTMSAIALRIVCGSMPCSVLYATCFSRRRLVSSMAKAIESVTRSAYMMTSPETFRAARPIVWMSERPLRRKPSLSASKNRDKRYLWQVEALPQEVDADQHVELPSPQVAQDLDAFERGDVGVQVAHPNPLLEQVVGQVLRHLLRERGDERALVRSRPPLDLADQVVDLALDRPNYDLRVDEAGRADDLLDDLLRDAQLVVARRRRHVDELRYPLLELVEPAAAGCPARSGAENRARPA